MGIIFIGHKILFRVSAAAFVDATQAMRQIFIIILVTLHRLPAGGLLQPVQVSPPQSFPFTRPPP